MKRTALLLGAIAAALAFSGSALAAFNPKLTITHSPLTPQGGGKTDVTVSFDQNDDATARVLIYAAPGYTGSLGAPGQAVGTAEAQGLTSIAPTRGWAPRCFVRSMSRTASRARASTDPSTTSGAPRMVKTER